MNKIYILLGANLGAPIVQIGRAFDLLQDRIGEIVESSAIYTSEGWGVKDQPLFYNQVLIIETPLEKQECLTICQEIELELGRVRLVKWGARLIDIDIIYFNDEVYESKNLIIPHPLLQLRNFVLVPLCEVADGYIHPVLHVSNKELLSRSTDELIVKKYN
ncbi:2-amino-4-hydroxy-6-hydroxymethyldihydropteridine diphosphokinase [Sphingobacterium faecale]|uniref:2-amino-4-hydroxy-6-hydroxymethyldihydropteridine pyrophosphokinase n=1 Tax=Sphingobacterium faecale TaxID=2803775 RepID=A0ABS1R5B2_9SPHI|nr:2-amino-4-hydroxy-6-hydroxymethyldihydropteridine diphosphokinase [Sphingobacterium faecale]MBL1409888.1 2-amino-4-hydroxy-6-hydroxymethyldihydropteridine diphosphokinase [Sphingobacterium faecale]